MWHQGIFNRTAMYPLLAALTVFFSSSLGQTPKPNLPWVRNVPSNHGVIIFVHGVTGEERSTWTSDDGHFWPSMLLDDPAFEGENVYVYHYSSPRFGPALTVDQLADNMRLIFRADGVLRHKEITIVSHSMGGIVTRAFIVKYQQEMASKIRLLYFFATPSIGHDYAKVMSLISKNPQFKQLIS